MALLAPLAAATASTVAPIVIEEIKKVANRNRSRSRPRKGKGKGQTGGKKRQNQRARNQSNQKGPRKGAQPGRGTVAAKSASGTSQFGGDRVDAKELAAFRKMAVEALGVLKSGTAGVTKTVTVGGASVSFNFAHLASRNTDKRFKNGVRVTITDVDGGGLGGTGYLLVRGGNSAQTSEPLANDTGLGAAANTTRVRISPAFMSTLSYTLSQVFEFYAFRYIRFRYRPVAGAYTTTTINTNVALAMGIEYDPDSKLNGANLTFKKICEMENHAVFHVTEPAELEFVGNGVETWSCNDADAADERYQAAFVAQYDSIPTLGANPTNPGPTYGHIESFMVFDLYGLRAPDTGVPSLQDAPTPVSGQNPTPIVAYETAKRPIVDTSFKLDIRDEKFVVVQPPSVSNRSKSLERK